MTAVFGNMASEEPEGATSGSFVGLIAAIISV